MSIALPCDQSSVARAAGWTKWSSATLEPRDVSTRAQSTRTAPPAAFRCRFSCAAAISGSQKRIRSLPSCASIVYDAGDGGKKANCETTRSIEQRLLQSRQPIAVLMTQPMNTGCHGGGVEGGAPVALKLSSLLAPSSTKRILQKFYKQELAPRHHPARWARSSAPWPWMCG